MITAITQFLKDNRIPAEQYNSSIFIWAKGIRHRLIIKGDKIFSTTFTIDIDLKHPNSLEQLLHAISTLENQ